MLSNVSSLYEQVFMLLSIPYNSLNSGNIHEANGNVFGGRFFQQLLNASYFLDLP